MKDTRLLAGKDATPAQNLEKFCKHAHGSFATSLPALNRSGDVQEAKMRLPAPNGWKLSEETLGERGGKLTVQSSGTGAANLELAIMTAKGTGSATECTLNVAGSPRAAEGNDTAGGQTLSFDLTGAFPLDGKEFYLIVGDPHLTLESNKGFARTFLVDLEFTYEPAPEPVAKVAETTDDSQAEGTAQAAAE